MGYCIEHLPSRISIGRETETGVTDIRIDCTDWLDKWPGMAISAMYRPPEGEPYIVLAEMIGNSLVWHVSDADTATPGTGRLELTGIAEGKRKLSALVDVQVARRLEGAAGPMPEAAKPWADEVMAAAATVELAAQAAKDAAVSAGEHASAAGEAAATAETAAMTAQAAAESAQEAEAKAQSAADRAEAAAGSGSGGGANDVYTVKFIEDYDAHMIVTEGTLQEAIAAYTSGKRLKLRYIMRYNGEDIFINESFSFSAHENSVTFFFVMKDDDRAGFNIAQFMLTEDGVSLDQSWDGDTLLYSLYIVNGSSLFLRSSTVGSKKMFRIKVDDSGNLSTEFAEDLE